MLLPLPWKILLNSTLMTDPAAARPPFIIPIFIVHQGCPHRCVFCDQGSITGQSQGAGQVTSQQVAAEIVAWLARPRRNPEAEVQVAFYGGSFTWLPKARQNELLDAVAPFLANGQVQGVRLSTRPDCLDLETAAFLASKGVLVVELGVQSMDAAVLAASGRGYEADEVARAMLALRGAGIKVGGQLMVGLPGESSRRAVDSAQSLAALAPDFIRIYPTLVVAGSRLALDYAAGRYRPLSLHQAVARTARIKGIFDACSIPVVRMGLQESASLTQNLIAGPHHPAFGEMVLARLFFKKVRHVLRQRAGTGGRLTMAAADESIFRGPGNRFRQRLLALGLLTGIEVVFVPGLPRQTVRVQWAG